MSIKWTFAYDNVNLSEAICKKITFLFIYDDSVHQTNTIPCSGLKIF